MPGPIVAQIARPHDPVIVVDELDLIAVFRRLRVGEVGTLATAHTVDAVAILAVLAEQLLGVDGLSTCGAV